MKTLDEHNKEIMNLPYCKSHNKQMLLRPVEIQTKIDKECGVWYDCPEKCANSVLFLSKELRAKYD